MSRYFITGTDTNCGKTYVTCELLKHFKRLNKNVLAIKPVVSGRVVEKGREFYEDIRALQHYNEDTAEIAKWCFEAPVSPHIAAAQENCHLSMSELIEFCLSFPERELLLIEGAGGLMVPLNTKDTWIDFLQLSQIPVILIVGVRLGCLNHALLTAHALKSHNIPCAGWIANCVDEEMLELEANIETLKTKLEWPLWGRVEHNGGLVDCPLNLE